MSWRTDDEQAAYLRANIEHNARLEATEECARMVESWPHEIVLREIARAIRALKDKP